MPPTTLEVPDALTRRVNAAARAAKKSPQAFMLDALERETRGDEARRAFVADAQASLAEVQKSGETYAVKDVFRYLSARVRGEKGETADAARVAQVLADGMSSRHLRCGQCCARHTSIGCGTPSPCPVRPLVPGACGRRPPRGRHLRCGIPQNRPGASGVLHGRARARARARAGL